MKVIKTNSIKILIYLVFFLTVSPNQFFAQDHAAIHQKYWYYRYRLKNHFTKVGKLQGESLILSQRAGPEGTERMAFGDQTTMLGQYIAILALEYHFLAENNQNTDETLDELFHAMWAFNRLDLNAESYFRATFTGEPDPQPGDLNGFFVKDDADQQFFQENIEHFNSDKIESNQQVDTLLSAWNHGINEPDDGFLVDPTPGNRTWGNAEMSQDQVFYIMFGMAMVNNLIPLGVVYSNESFQDGESSINQEAAAIMLRVLSFFNGTSNPNLSNWYNWQLYNPVWNMDVGQDQDSWLITAGIARAACNTMFDLNTIPNPCDFQFGGLSYNNLHSEVLNPPVWYYTRNGVVLPGDNPHMLGMLNAMIGRSNNNPLYPSYILGIIGRSVEHVPLVKQVLHGGSNIHISNQFYTDLLEEAPCEGPFAFNWATGDVGNAPGGVPSFEWSTSDRILHPQRRGVGPTFSGEYPGIDFMLYHNLYYYIQDSDYSSPVNMMTRKIDIGLPYNISGTDIGTASLPYLLESFGSITASNEIEAQGSNPNDGASDVTYRAGCEIKLQTGFHVEVGSDFHAHIERFTCGSDGGYKMAMQDSSNMAVQSAVENLRTHQEMSPYNVKTFNFDESDPEIYDEADEMNNEESLGMLGWVYPNPAQNELEIRIPEELRELPYKIEVYSLLSSKVAEFENYQGSTIDVSSFPRGLCIFRFIFGNGEFELSEKIILE